MNLKQVRYFLALCEECNFTRAAERCAVTQPTLTIAIRQLEAELGGSLFKREGRTSNLSELGTAVRPYLESVDSAVIGAKRAAAVVRASGTLPDASASGLPFDPEENIMRKVTIVSAAVVILLLLLSVTIRFPHSAGASPPPTARGPADAYTIESTVDVKALPTVEPLSEADPFSPESD
jgi:Bacterial regulatory helix-turn-helix protein, lysR family